MRWTTRVCRQALRSVRSRPRRRAHLRIESLEAREVPHVSGTVFIDLNLNGLQDADDTGVAGVTVKATDAAGATETATTGADGTYTLETDAQPLRIEFSTIPGGLAPGRVTATSGPLVRFLDAGANREAVDLALAAPRLVTTRFAYDHALLGVNAAEPAVVAVPYGADSTTVPTVLATVADVGSVWGLAYHPSSNRVYASSFVKRHAGLGPAADGTTTTTGGIYALDPAGIDVPTLLIDLNAAGTGLGAGADPHPTQPDPDGDWFHDPNTLPVVGKRGLGGLAVSADGRTLFTINLATRELLEIPLNADGTRDALRSIRRTSIPLANPAGSGIASFTAADLRPFAVTIKDGAVFVGVTYTAETSARASDLRAFVYAFDPEQGAFRAYNQQTQKFAAGPAAPVVTVNLTYARGAADDPTPDEPNSGDEISADWTTWVTTFRTDGGQEGFPVRPSPWLTDIAFDGPNMVLGIRDRFGDQGGFLTGNTTAGSETEFSVIAVGDILRAAPSGSGWQVESNGASGGVTTQGAGNGQGPGGGEFYFQDGSAEPVPEDVTAGGLAQVPGFNTIAATGSDPTAAFTGGLYTFFNADVSGGDATQKAGMVSTRTAIYESFDLNTFGSANGMGDVAALPGAGTVQIGDRVFHDADADGAQDPGEPGLNGVVLRLFKDATEVDSVATGVGGDFLFDELLPNTAYQVRIDTVQTGLFGRTLSPANQGTDDLLDSDATLSGTTATISVTTGDAGTATHGLDVGFSGEAATPTLTLGGTVFRDTANDGFGTGDAGVSGVTVELLNADGTAVLNTTTTNSIGTYTFAGLAAGTYQVRLATANFSGAGALIGFVSSTPSADNPNNDTDNDDNGIGAGSTIQSGPVTLAVDGEPTGDGDQNANTNLTVDFGVVPPRANVTLGDTVFRDANNNGTQDQGEPGLSGVTVELLDQAGSNVLGTTTTNSSGNYSFAGLVAGTYRVGLAAANFSTGGVLFGFIPSAGGVIDPNNNSNADSNGTASGTLGQGGFVISGPIALAPDEEPDTDGDTNKNTNRTLDFGLVPPGGTLTLGNLVFSDANANGTFDTLEAGIVGVTVQLVSPQGAVLQTTTTAAGGVYTFAGIAPGDYKVRLAASNFNTGGPLANFAPSSGSPADPDDNANNINDGLAVGLLGSGGYVESLAITLTANAENGTDGDNDSNTNLSLDFGLAAKVPNRLTLGDRVFRDTNNNGRLDSGESGVAGVTVQLIGSTATVIRSAVTDAQGLYQFQELVPGNYQVRVPATNFQAGGALVGFTSSAGAGNAFEGGATPSPNSDADGDDNGITVNTLGQANGYVESKAIALALNGEPTTDGDGANGNRTLDFGFVPSAAGTLSLGGTVWTDANNDGLLGIGEAGLTGVTVQLLDSGGAVARTATTDASGNYSFTELAAGVYRVRLPASNFTTTGATAGPLVGFASSTGTNGSVSGPFEGLSVPNPNGGADSDDNGQAGGILGTASGVVETGAITLTAGAAPNTTLDLGVFKRLSLGNTVFSDANNNGTQDTGEPGIGNVSVRLLNPDAGFAQVATTSTNAQGQYLFSNLVPGNYVVELAAANFNAGGVLSASQSSGGAFEPAPAGASDKQDHGTATGTLGSGGSVRSRTVAVSPTGPTGENPNSDPLTPDAQTDLTVDFGLFQQTPATASIAGRVFRDLNNNGVANGALDTGIADVTMTLSGGGLSSPITVTTDADGNFTFNNLQAGSYTLTQTQPTTPVTMSGKVTAGNAGGTVAAATNSVSGIALTVGKAATGYNFAEVPATSLGGSVFEDTNANGVKDAGEPGIPNATITLTGSAVGAGAIAPRTATTDANGAYTFTGVAPGTYTLTETQPTGFTDGKDANGFPAAATATNDKFAGINLTTATTGTAFNFGEIKGASLGGFVYSDANNDGAKAAIGEPGIAGAKVRVTGTDDQGKAVDLTTTTGSDGSYLFGSLRPGTYRLLQTQPAGFADGKETTGTPAGNTATNDQITGITLASGTAATGFLFGEQPRADLKLTQTPGTAVINRGGTVTFTYTLRNLGTAPAAGSAVAVNLGGMTFVSASAPGEFNTSTRTWTAGDVANGETKTIRLTLRASGVGTFAPSAQATTTATELVTTNNRSSSVVSAGVAAPSVETPAAPIAKGFLKMPTWFLSSSTNARRRR